MRRFVLTSPSHKGYVEAIYDTSDELWRINFCNATINRDWKKAYKNRITILVDNLETAFAETGIKVEEKDFEVLFDDFKREYPYKRNTHLAEAYWHKLTSSKQYCAFVAAIEYAQYCNRRNLDKQFILLPEKFLKTEQWKNNWREL